MSEPHEHHALLHVEYDGAPFHGWSRQPGDVPTIEGAILAAFDKLGCDATAISCAGRTDAGVHASAQVVGARYVGPIPPERIAHALNGSLPREIAAVASAPAPAGFDPRGDATSRAYEYRVLCAPEPSALRARYVLHHPRRLDRDVLAAAAAAILGTHDFTAFTPSRTLHSFFDRTVVVSRWVERGDELVYQIRANAFLRHMVRVIIGTMLSIARGERAIDQLHAMLAGAPRSDAAATAPAQGLCFVDVTWSPVDGLPLPPRWVPDREAALRELAHVLPSACAFPPQG